MLPAENRLKNKEDFSRIMREGRKTKFGPLMFFTQKTETPTRVGLVISKRVSKLATDRNQIRRFLKEIFRRELNNISGFDIVVSVLSLPRNGRVDLEEAVGKWQKSL